MELEVTALFILQTIGRSIFGKFEAETPWWKSTMKWLIIFGITWLLYHHFGHAISLSFLGLIIIAALTFHFSWCTRNHIHPLKATPVKRYYELRKWKQPE